MNTLAYEELKRERRRLQGSVNYWTLTAKTWRTNIAKYAGNERRQANAQRQLDQAETRLAEATQKHKQISEQLTALDPQGSQARQLHSLQNQLGRARSALQQAEHQAANNTEPEAKAFWQSKATKLRETVARYAQRINDMRTAIATDRQQQLDLARSKAKAEHLAIVSQAYAPSALADELGQAFNTEKTERQKRAQ